MIEQLTHLDFGDYRVETVSGSVYEVHLEGNRSWVVRHPGVEAPSVKLLGDVSQLRLDGLRVPLVGLFELHVGRPAVMMLDVRRDGVLTSRWTTPIRAISQWNQQPD